MEQISYKDMIPSARREGEEWAEDNYPAGMPEDGIGHHIDERVFAEAALKWASERNTATESVRFLLAHYFLEGAMKMANSLLEMWRIEKAGIDPHNVMAISFDIYNGDRLPQSGIPTREFTAVIDADYKADDPAINERTEQEALDYCKKYFWWVPDVGQREGDTFKVRWADPTQIRRVTINPTEPFHMVVADYQYEKNLKSWGQAVLALAKTGLESVTGKQAPKAYSEWGGKRDSNVAG